MFYGNHGKTPDQIEKGLERKGRKKDLREYRKDEKKRERAWDKKEKRRGKRNEKREKSEGKEEIRYEEIRRKGMLLWKDDATGLTEELNVIIASIQLERDISSEIAMN